MTIGAQNRILLSKQRHPVRHWIRNVLGFLLIGVGIVGLVFPILQGVIFIVIGLGMIEVPAKHRLHRWLSGRWRCYRRVALTHHRVKHRMLRAARRRRNRHQSPAADDQKLSAPAASK